MEGIKHDYSEALLQTLAERTLGGKYMASLRAAAGDSAEEVGKLLKSWKSARWADLLHDLITMTRAVNLLI